LRTPSNRSSSTIRCPRHGAGLPASLRQPLRRQSFDEVVNMRECIASSPIESISPISSRPCCKDHCPPLPPTGHRVACAAPAPRDSPPRSTWPCLGHDVTSLKNAAEAGGHVRFAIPELPVPKSVLRRELDLIEGVGSEDGVQNVRVGIRSTLNELASRFDAVFPLPSAPGRSPGSIFRERAEGVYPALPFLESVAKT